MSKFDFEKAVERYNGIMMDICVEHSTIGTVYSEGTEGWNIRDMVAECEYWLSTYYESGHSREDLRREDYPVWRSETGKLKRFIKAYEKYIDEVACSSGHCSKYDK